MNTLGFTGTQHGMTPEQAAALVLVIDKLQPSRARHGDCIGADAEFHLACWTREVPIYLHPPDNPVKRAWCPHASWSAEPRPYMDRNRDIVHGSTWMVATPKGMVEELRSGTWSTIRYARRLKAPILIIFPDGTLGASRQWPSPRKTPGAERSRALCSTEGGSGAVSRNSGLPPASRPTRR
jgi:hypothetical protein